MRALKYNPEARLWMWMTAAQDTRPLRCLLCELNVRQVS